MELAQFAERGDALLSEEFFATLSATRTRRASFCGAILVKANTSETPPRQVRARDHAQVG